MKRIEKSPELETPFFVPLIILFSLLLLVSCSEQTKADGGPEQVCYAVGGAQSTYLFAQGDYELAQTYDCIDGNKTCVKVVSLTSGQWMYSCNVPPIQKRV